MTIKPFAANNLAAARGFDAGNYANAYETEDLNDALDGSTYSEAFRAAFILGFFSSYEPHEIPANHFDTYNEARAALTDIGAALGWGEL